MKSSAIASLASIAVILVVGVAYLTFGVARVNPFRETLTVTMAITESGGLLPRSKVLLSGVEVGRVTEVEHAGRGVRVVFEVDASYPIPVDSPARIESLSALGEPYLEFRPTGGSGPYLRNGQTVRADNVARPMSIPEVAKIGTQLLRQLDPAKLAAIVDTFSVAMDGTETVVPQLSRATDLLAATLLSRTDLIRGMLVSLQANAGDMAWSGPALQAAAGPWADFGPRVADVAGALGRVMRASDAPDSFLVDNEKAIGLVPWLLELADRVDRLGPELQPLVPLLKPLTRSGVSSLAHLDLGSLISQALHMTSEDGTLQLRISVK
ncbi:MlaD family protein [Nocardia sp. NPDC127526]|uniref:MlaD family protein n=1 Tax=Nocardia sp. NPDC127526 TaxID=3345393 RepID=UPI00362FB9CB